MAKLLIITPLSDVYSGVGNIAAPPLRPWRLDSFLRQNGQTVDVWDCNVSDSLHLPAPSDHPGRDRAEVLAEAFVESINQDFPLSNYDWIGFSLLSDTLVTSLSIIELIRRRCPSTKMIAGNHEATVNLQDCLGKSQLNAVILADAEEPMLRLMRGEAPHTIPGVVWRNFNPKPPREKFEEWNDSIQWNVIPFERYWEKTSALYDWSAMSEEERLTKTYEIRTVRVHSLVACELACRFCSVANTRRIASGSMKPSIINLSPDALARNLLAIKAQVPGVMTIYDSCDEAWLGKGRGEEYCAVLESIKPTMDEGLPRGLRYLVQVRTNDLTESLVDYAARVGVRHITIGVESPVEQVRRDMMKPQKESHVRESIQWGVSRGIDMYLLFIAFYPTIVLEQLYEAVENWRAYVALGATISIEPFAMAYGATALSEDTDFFTEHVSYNIPFSGTPAKRVKWPTLVWPSDRRVCAVLQWVRANLDDYIAAKRRTASHKHAHKGWVATVIVDCIEQALKLWEQGRLPPWDMVGGHRSMVYQDYGDQLSGAEVAAAALESDKRTTTRFNSTHASLDSVGAVKGRIKDPALPHEMHLPAIKDEK